ncbi:LCP family protein required for cell wall assembly [Enterococcus sp. PF1-24]|uniref:LCP family protein n=1 Tax=unclassified Enterococcus TaxID=2608891 RepID=UPI002475C814|nr:MULTISPECIES: LCP family protein [unclassified Enterococcus]MDH6363619.1 LCP family protein required for cell wall assembly [Enterococcus sp. PFB1-1]MDH6400854.1 LCP family protein required for cell wall assembly [Enterococcus sp. PF1-24]
MRIWQKIVLGFTFLILVLVTTGTVYFAKFLSDTSQTMANIYVPVERIDAPQRDIDFSQLEPFSILLLGVDTNSEREGDGDGGRTDSMIVATINPGKEQTTLVSIPRDTLVYMDYDYDGYTVGWDKVNSAYAYGGEALAIHVVEKLLDIPIDHVATVNMDGMIELIDAVDGIDVDNQFTFELDGEYFEPGMQHMNGRRSVMYARMRYEDERGDYGRQERQREVLGKVFDKLKSVDIITKYQSLLEVLSKNGQTDLSWQQIEPLLDYLPALKNFTSDQLQGEDYIGDGETGMEEISYQKASEYELDRVQALLKDQLQQVE